MSHIETTNPKMSLFTFAELKTVPKVIIDELLYDDRPDDCSTSIIYMNY